MATLINLNLDLSEFGLKNNQHYLRIYKKHNIHKTILKNLNDFKLRKKLSKNAFTWSKKNTFYHNLPTPYSYKKIHYIICCYTSEEGIQLLNTLYYIKYL